MTVKELREKLAEFPDDLEVMTNLTMMKKARQKMKLIIEVDEKDKEICKQYANGKLGDELGDYVNITELAEAIANGTPYNPTGDTISRRVVKNLLGDKSIPIKFEKEKRRDWHRSLGMTLGDIYTVIDNAPTVSPLYAKAYKCGYEAGKNERPKAISDYFVSYTKTCHICGYSLATYNPEDYKFCPRCGMEF